MKLITTILALSAGAQMAWASNGSLLHGLSPSSSAQGGVGVARNQSTIEAIHKNAATIGAQNYGEGKVNAEAAFTIINQKPSVDVGAGFTSSKAGVSFLPAIGASYKINNDWAFGIGVMSYGGGVSDFSTLAAYSGIQTKHSLVKLQPGVSYNANEWLSIGVAPILNYAGLTTNVLEAGTQSTRSADNKFGLGVQAGIALKPVKGLDVGVTYTSQSKLGFTNMIDWGVLTTGTPSGLSPITVTQPTEIAAGVAYAVTDAWRVAFDWRYIAWRGAAGYGDLGWNDQQVLALGTSYQLEKLQLRAGFNWGKTPIDSATGVNGIKITNFQGANLPNVLLDRFNLIAFPALAQTHITVGAGYQVTNGFDLDVAFMYSPKVSVVRSGTTLVAAPSTLGPYSITSEIQQWSATLAGTYRF